jgi:hypothetical protein
MASSIGFYLFFNFFVGLSGVGNRGITGHSVYLSSEVPGFLAQVLSARVLGCIIIEIQFWRFNNNNITDLNNSKNVNINNNIVIFKLSNANLDLYTRMLDLTMNRTFFREG